MQMQYRPTVATDRAEVSNRFGACNVCGCCTEFAIKKVSIRLESTSCYKRMSKQSWVSRIHLRVVLKLDKGCMGLKMLCRTGVLCGLVRIHNSAVYFFYSFPTSDLEFNLKRHKKSPRSSKRTYVVYYFE